MYMYVLILNVYRTIQIGIARNYIKMEDNV